MKPEGWRKEPARHALAAKGVKTKLVRKLKGGRLVVNQHGRNDEPTLESLSGKELGYDPAGPGKFEGASNEAFAEAVHSVFGEGFGDEELGDVQDFGWYGCLDVSEYKIREDGHPIVGVIAYEDNFGFFSTTRYHDKKEFKKAWADLEAEYQTYSEQSDGKMR